MDENKAIEEMDKNEELNEPVIEEPIPFEDKYLNKKIDMGNCPVGSIYVKPFKKADGTYIRGFCRKMHKDNFYQ